MGRVRNEALAARIAEAGWTQPNAAAAVRRVAEEVGARELAAISRSYIAMWILGTRPSGQSPRNNPRWPPTGPLAHRNHRRPNQLAISCPRLLGIDGRDLLVTDLDAVDGTPVIDIAPWFTDMGPRGPVQEPAWPGEMLENYWRDAESR